jgi:copper(I)-binding protein
LAAWAGVSGTVAGGGSAAQPTLAALSAWVAVPAAGATSTAAYVQLNNPTMYDIYITAASADAAAKVELRAGGAGGAEPRPVAEFAVPAYGSTEAAATGPHLLLVDLARPLAAGDTVQLTLTTDGGVQIKVAATVRTP